jgi:hypothetical protein
VVKNDLQSSQCGISCQNHHRGAFCLICSPSAGKHMQIHQQEESS